MSIHLGESRVQHRECVRRRRQKLWGYLSRQARRNIYPSYRDLIYAFGYSSASVLVPDLKYLEELGYIKRGSGSARSIVVLVHSSGPLSEVR